jgi:hypothetical protein
VDAHDAAVNAASPEAPLLAQSGFRSRVVPLHADHVASIRPALLLLQGGALLLLVVGAAGVEAVAALVTGVALAVAMHGHGSEHGIHFFVRLSGTQYCFGYQGGVGS